MSALPILDIQQNYFRILKDNFNSVLTKVGDRPFTLISINGATRTGKSFALNYFIRYLTLKTGNQVSFPTNCAESWPELKSAPKFVSRAGRTRTTLGIDLWSEPFIIQKDGREIAVLFMDCQGLFDDQTTTRQNAIIFSLSSLCSSMSVFNLMRNIDESILQQIQFFSGYAHLVSQEKENNSENEQPEENSFQRLIFLIRDFEFPGYEFGYHGETRMTTSENNFFREVFHASGQMEIPPENLFVREEILRSYKDVGCFLLPHPGRQFTRDETKPVEKEFEEHVKEFVELVLSPGNLVTKRIGGQEITGNDFKRFVDEWGKLCEKAEDHFPAVQTIAESTATIQNTLAVNTALSHYEKVMSSFGESYPRGLPDSEFLKLHEKLQSEALSLFKGSQKLGGKTLTTQYEKSLVELIKKLHESSRQFNLILVSKAAMDEELKKNKEKVSEFQDKLSDVETQYKRDKEQQDKVISGLEKKMDRDSAANEEERKFYEDKLAVALNNFSQRTQAAEEQKKRLEEQISEMEMKFIEKQKEHEEVLAMCQDMYLLWSTYREEKSMKILKKLGKFVILPALSVALAACGIVLPFA